MWIARLRIEGFRGANAADIQFGPKSVLIGPNNSGKTTIVEALALLCGRDRLVRRLTEHDFYLSDPIETSRILIVATVTGFPHDNPNHNLPWFGMEAGVEKWLDQSTGELHDVRKDDSWSLAVQIGFAARFDLEELEAETVRFFVDDEETLADPFGEETYLKMVHFRVLQELGFFLVPASRTWDRWISFSSELFRRVVSSIGGTPAEAIRNERKRLCNPDVDERLENQEGLSEIVASMNEELRHLLASAPSLQLRLTGTDSDSVLEAVSPHFVQGEGPTLPAVRQGSGLVSMQSLLLLMQLGRARSEAGKSFILAVEEPELHIQPSQQRRLVNRLNALCDQTIVTTHSPTVAGMFMPSEIRFVETVGGVLTARPLVAIDPAEPTNHEQHLFFAWRQRLVAALMHETVVIPEGISDVAWLESLQAALESHQEWDVADERSMRFGTFVGLVPTMEAKIEATYRIIKEVHSRSTVLLDGDAEGRNYFDVVRGLDPAPPVVVFWPEGWPIERVVSWIAEADEERALTAIGAAVGEIYEDCGSLVDYLLARKSYVPTQENVCAILMANSACRERAAGLLGALTYVLSGQDDQTGRFEIREDDTSESTRVFRMVP